MASEEIQDRAGLSDLLTDLTDSDVVIEVASSAGTRKIPDAGPVRLIQDAVEASYRALAGAAQVQFETVAVLEEVSKRSLSLWLRVQATDGALAAASDASSLKFLARGTLAIIAWMDGSPTLQLADLQQAIRVLAPPVLIRCCRLRPNWWMRSSPGSGRREALRRAMPSAS
jgi:hypothetical protein